MNHRLMTGALCAALFGSGACVGSIGDSAIEGSQGDGTGSSGSHGASGATNGSGGNGTGPVVATGLPGLADCDPKSPGGATSNRRLSKVELANSLRDLFGATVYSRLENVLSTFPDEGSDQKIEAFASENLLATADVAFQVATVMAGGADTQALNDLVKKNSACATVDAASGQATCVHDFISRFGTKVMRRPPTDADIAWLTDIYNTGTDAKDRFHALLMSLVQMPEFLYHMELGAASGSNTAFDLTPYEIASRLSFALWDSMPSDDLLKAAANGDLRDPARRSAIVAMMIQDPRTKAKMSRFFDAWLQTATVPDFSTNPTFLAGIKPDGLKTEMIAEMGRFLDAVIWKNKKGYKELLTTKATYATGTELPKIYGTGRMGLLLRGPLLLNQAQDIQPIVRGARLRKQVLCDALAPPDPSALRKPEVLALDTPAAIKQYTTRERVEMKTAPAQCTTCHSVINSLGFALEGYDGLGRTRTKEIYYDAKNAKMAEHPIDTTVAALNIEEGAPDTATSAEELVTIIGNGKKGPTCLSRAMFRFFKRQTEDTTADACVLGDMSLGVQGDNGSILTGLERMLTNALIGKKVVAQ